MTPRATAGADGVIRPRAAVGAAWAELPGEDPGFRRIVGRVARRARAEKRLRWLASAYLVAHGAMLALASLLLAAIAPWGWSPEVSTGSRLLGGAGSAVALLLALLALPGFVAGLGLLARRSWAQGLALGVAVAALFWAPVGTACGLASLWVLLQEEVRALFAPPRGRATRVRGLPPPERGGADSGLAAL